MTGKPSRTYIPLYPVPPLPVTVKKVNPEDSIWFWPDIKIAKSDKSDDSVAESDDSFAEPTDPKRIQQGKPLVRNNQNRPLPKAQARQGCHTNSEALSPLEKGKAQGVGYAAGGSKRVRASHRSFSQRSTALI